MIAEVTNQVTGEESTRTLRWDQHVTTEEPLEVAIGKIRLELALQREEEDRAVYKFEITDEAPVSITRAWTCPGGETARGQHQGRQDASELLVCGGRSVRDRAQGGVDSENLDLFDMKTNEWAYLNMEHIEMAQVELIRGLER